MIIRKLQIQLFSLILLRLSSQHVFEITFEYEEK